NARIPDLRGRGNRVGRCGRNLAPRSGRRARLSRRPAALVRECRRSRRGGLLGSASPTGGVTAAKRAPSGKQIQVERLRNVGRQYFAEATPRAWHRCAPATFPLVRFRSATRSAGPFSPGSARMRDDARTRPPFAAAQRLVHFVQKGHTAWAGRGRTTSNLGRD